MIDFFLNITASLGYTGIFILMVVESSFVPFPSEVVIPPAAYLAASGKMNIFLVVLMGVFGSLVGALINYFLALYLGRRAVYRLVDLPIFRYLLLNSEKIHQAEQYFLKRGAVSTFIGRLLPGIRQLISLPAGFARMNFAEFCFFTSLGSGIWVIVLAVLGYYFHESVDMILEYYKELSLGLLLLLMFAVVIYKTRKKG